MKTILMVFCNNPHLDDGETILWSNPKTEVHAQELILRMKNFQELEDRLEILERQLSVAMSSMNKAMAKSYPVYSLLNSALEEINRIENPAQNEAEKAFRL